MAQDGILPFERGTTFKDGFTASHAVPAVAASIAGSEFPVVDDSEGHGTGQTVVLMPLIAQTGITINRRLVRASSLNTRSAFQAVNGSAAAGGSTGIVLGGLAYLPDDRYTSGTSIVAGDIFHVVKKGPCLANLNTRGGNIIVGDRLVAQTGGHLRKASGTTEQHVIAIAMDTCNRVSATKMVNVVRD